jgi:hypothetical protein
VGWGSGTERQDKGEHMNEIERTNIDEIAEDGQSLSGNLVLLLLLAWATIALGGYYIAVRMVT